MKISEAAVVERLKAWDNILVLTHVRPDGDTLCSAAALTDCLQKMGKTAYLAANPEVGEKYHFHVGSYFAPEGYSYDKIISVDMASDNMIPAVLEISGPAVDMAIDHHGSNSGYAKETCVDPAAAACGEIVYRVILDLQGSITEKQAELLYIALTTDTGCFVYANTTEETLRIASQLVHAGADNAALNKRFFRTKPRSRIMMERMLYNDMRFYEDGRIAVIRVTRDMVHTCGATEDDVDDIASIPGAVEGVMAGVTLKERDDGGCKISLRTMAHVNASAICAKFGGGGHLMAAGCSMDVSLDEAEKEIVAAIVETLRNK